MPTPLALNGTLRRRTARDGDEGFRAASGEAVLATRGHLELLGTSADVLAIATDG